MFYTTQKLRRITTLDSFLETTLSEFVLKSLGKLQNSMAGVRECHYNEAHITIPKFKKINTRLHRKLKRNLGKLYHVTS